MARKTGAKEWCFYVELEVTADENVRTGNTSTGVHKKERTHTLPVLEVVSWTLQQKWRRREKEGEEHKLKTATQVEETERVLCAFFIPIPSRPSTMLCLLHWRVHWACQNQNQQSLILPILILMSPLALLKAAANPLIAST